MNLPEISVQKLAALQKAGDEIVILDVRNPDEYAICNLKDYLIPMPELPARYQELDQNKKIIVHCHAGSRA